MFRVAGRQLNQTVSECHDLSARMAPLLLQYNSFASQSKKAFTGSEILNYMGGVDNDKKQLIHKLVNFRMRQGKKTKVREIFHETLHKLARTDRDGIQLISDAVDNVKPICEVANVRIAGNVYVVPSVVDKDRQQMLAVCWFLHVAKKRRADHSLKLEECLVAEIMDAYRNKGKAREKRQDLQKTAAINQSYAHFKWW